MKQILFFLLVLFSGFGFPVISQQFDFGFKLIDTTNIKCTYHFRFLKDSTKMEYNSKDLSVIN